MISSTANKSC